MSGDCLDCGSVLTPSDVPNESSCDEVLEDAPSSVDVCRRCTALRVERKEAIQELVDTELSYGKDLHIIKEVWVLSSLRQKSPSSLSSTVYL